MGGATRFLVLLATPFPPRTPSLLRLARHHHYRHRLSPLSSPSLARDLSGSSRRIRSFRVNSSSSQQLHSQAVTFRDDHFSESAPPKHAGAQHPWPEWFELLGNLSAGGYLRGDFGASSPEVECEDEYAAGVSLQEDFLSAARACLAFARDRPHLLPALPRNDVEIVVNNGTPFLFKNADDSIRRMRSFLSGGEVEDSDKPQTIDLMRFLLSYASYPMMDDAANFSRQELVASSVRNLISELVKLSSTASGTKFSNPIQNQFTGRYGQSSRFHGQNIEMKRGDWICPRCSFMNFARNMKCLQCEEARPKRQLTGGEWECPQCNYLNHGRNMACLRCDCKHPRGFSPMSSGYSSGNNADRADLERRLAANEEKAQRWFSKVSQIDSTSDLSSAIDDEDFPEIMPLRKGVNRFVVSTRKTPLERRLANARNSSSDGALAPNDSQTGNSNNKTADSLLSRRLDDIMGRKSDDKMNSRVKNDVSTDGTAPYSNSPSPQQRHTQGNNSSYVPFVPLPADMFAKKPKNAATEDGKATEKGSSFGSNSKERTSAAVNSPSNVSDDKDREQEEKSERWFKRNAELPNERDLTAAISDEDFPEIMPMRKGENRFVVSKKKDRSLASPIYKRRAAMEQASNSNSNYVPFVPLPPDYFAKKETQQSNVGNTIDGAADGISSTSTKPQEQKTGNSEVGLGNWNGKSSEGNATKQMGSFENSTGESSDSQMSSNSTNMNEGTDTTSSLTQQPKNHSWSGKSLEGSAVKEPDPLDMSEEAKAERWFRRVAQIKDISELSQIPDEDFPSIMPMRKGVNRFVVSKRKTPLERRLTSSQYRRNLPVVSSESIKKDNESN